MDITTTLLKNLRIHLNTHPINLDTASLIDFLFQHYSEFVPVSTGITREKYRAVAFAVLDLIKERNEARGVETEMDEVGVETEMTEAGVENQMDEAGVEMDGRSVPYNEDLEKVMSLVGNLETAYGDDAFRTGFEAGARIVFEIYGERVGIIAD